MSCYTSEELIAFAMDPLREKNALIAAHLISCRQCREEFVIARTALQQDDVFLNDADRSEAHQAAAELKKSQGANIRFGASFKKIVKAASQLHGMVKLNDLFSASPRQAVFGAAAVRPSVMQRSVPADPQITFESNCKQSGSYYWKMTVGLPLTVNSMSRITIKLVDAEKMPIRRGTLRFLGQEIAISAGIASLPLKVFAENLRENEVEFIFEDKTVSPGCIRFLPEMFQ